MAYIKYASIINSFVASDPGSIYSNVFYSLLVKFDDGTATIVEGKADEIKRYLPFLRTPQDELEKISLQLDDLKHFIDRNIGEKFEGSISKELNYCLDSLYPIPNVLGMTIDEASSVLEAAGLVPVVTNPSANTTKSGIISKCVRNKNNFKAVDLTCKYDLPEVKGLPFPDALAQLELNGFIPDIRYETVERDKDGIVLSCDRKTDKTNEVVLVVGSALDERVASFLTAVEGADRYRKVMESWSNSGLEGAPEYSEIEKAIKNKCEFERLYGPKSLEPISKFIEGIKDKL